MSGIRARLMRLEKVRLESYSLKGLAEEMRRMRQSLSSEEECARPRPRTREGLQALLARTEPQSLAHTMASRALRNFDNGH